MMKNYCIACLLTTLFLAAAASAFAQDDPVRVRNANDDGDRPPMEAKGFKKENLFTGGNVTASFGSGFTMLGASPMLGYKLNDYVDAGAVINYIYTGYRDYLEYNDKVRQHVFGPGVFMRAYPVPFLFAQAQLEQNFTNLRYTPSSGSSAYQKSTSTISAPSLLLGAGYASGRMKGGTTFYYMSLLVDVLKNENSPYVRLDRDPLTGGKRVRMQPIIRAGFNIGLFQKRYRQYQEF